VTLKFVSPDEAYAPNLRDKRVVRRVSAVLDWCDLNLYEGRAVKVHSVRTLVDFYGNELASMRSVFGQQQNDLTRWLRYNLLVQSGTYQEGLEMYRYTLRPGAVARLRSLIGEEKRTPTDVEKYKLRHTAELESLTFAYNDSSSRLWHPLQNVSKGLKDELWSDYLPFDYDISACAPNLLTQTARMVGWPEEKLAGVQKYLDDKSGFRAHVQGLTGLTMKHTKGVINSLFNGARLSPHHTCKTFETLNYDRDALDRLKADPLVVELLVGIKQIWLALADGLQKGHVTKWDIYFALEREVIDVCHEYLRAHDNAFFSEHDGWRCAKPVNTADLSDTVYERTGYRLKFDKN
jgi:hypothetical protein